MSTTLYIRCVSHDPPLVGDEVGQHLSDLGWVWDAIRGREEWVAEWARRREDPSADDTAPPFDTWTRLTLVRFLTAHPRCDVDVVDEYGGTHPVPDFSVTVDNTIDPRVPHVKPWTFGQVKQLPGRERRVVVTDRPGDWASTLGRVRIVDTATTGREGTYPDVWPARVTLHLQVIQPPLLDRLRDLFTTTDNQAGAGWRSGTGDDLEVFELWPQGTPVVEAVR